mgnify:CR=1 FL=1
MGFNIFVILISVFLLLFSGTWLSIALFGTGVIALSFLGKGGMAHVLESVMYNAVASYSLVAIPLFVLMGEILIESGCSKQIFRGVKRLLKPIPGGMLHANIVACSIFAACSGSSTATTVAVGGVSRPELEAEGYAKGITLGSICAGGTLGVLIPPSIMMILYGSLTANSIGKLFIAGIIPGICLAAMFMIYIGVACTIHKDWAPPREKITSIGAYAKDVGLGIIDLWPVVLIIGGIMASIYGGFATPTEAGAVACVVSFLLWALYYRTLTWDKFKVAISETVIFTCQLMICVIGARAIGQALSLLKIPVQLSAFVAGLDISRYVIWACIVVIYMILGCLVDGIDLLIISVPVFYPIVTGPLGFDPIWFGVTLTVLLEMSLITPPVGFNLYVTHTISGSKSMMDTIKGTVPFVVVMLVSVIVLTIFPILATYLPSAM